MRALVLYGSKRGGTEGLATMIRQALVDEGLDTDVRPASRHVADVAEYDAVIVGGSLYSGRWNPNARRFIRKHAKELSEMPVWLFSSGPLDDSAATTDIPPVPQVSKLIERVGARGHMTFGGRLEPTAKGFPASAMAKTKAGDWRDESHVRRWVSDVVADLRRHVRQSPGG